LVDLGPERIDEIDAVERWAWFAPDEAGRMERVRANLAGPLKLWGAQTESGRLAGVAGSFHFDLPVPGGVLPTSGLTWVSVHPQFRRRGILRAMLGKHFEDARAAGELASLLTAAEVPIYTRFGYGQVDRVVRVSLSRGVELYDVPGADEVEVTLEDAASPAAQEAAERAYMAVGAATGRSGWTPARQDGAWSLHFDDPVETRELAEPLRVAIARRAGQPTGFALFRRKEGWSPDDVPTGKVHVYPLAAADAATSRALWSVVTNLDLTDSITTGPIPLDDPLFALLKNPRITQRLGDFLHLRILDLPGCLAARSYSSDADLVIEVADCLFEENAGRWRWQIKGGAADVSRTDAEPDVRLDVRLLGSVLLGGISPVAYLDAGQLAEHTPGAVQRLAQALWVPRQPHCAFGF
jgi:predicted acetyltransferase